MARSHPAGVNLSPLAAGGLWTVALFVVLTPAAAGELCVGTAAVTITPPRC